MNRRKKIKSIIEKKDKKANARNCLSNKPRYVSKADRDKTAATEVDPSVVADS